MRSEHVLALDTYSNSMRWHTHKLAEASKVATCFQFAMRRGVNWRRAHLFGRGAVVSASVEVFTGGFEIVAQGRLQPWALDGVFRLV